MNQAMSWLDGGSHGLASMLLIWRSCWMVAYPGTAAQSNRRLQSKPHRLARATYKQILTQKRPIVNHAQFYATRLSGQFHQDPPLHFTLLVQYQQVTHTLALNRAVAWPNFHSQDLVVSGNP
jgi:hypothetical protein